MTKLGIVINFIAFGLLCLAAFIPIRSQCDRKLPPSPERSTRRRPF